MPNTTLFSFCVNTLYNHDLIHAQGDRDYMLSSISIIGFAPASNFIAAYSRTLHPLLDAYFHLGQHLCDDIPCRTQLDVRV